MLQLYLYAQSNGKTILTLDEVSSISIQIHNESCSNNIFDPAVFHVFHAFCLFLPFAIYLFVSLIIQSCRPKIRHMLDLPTPRNSNNPNYAALVLVGLIFSAYVVACDIFVITRISGNDELNPLDKYEEQKVHNFTKDIIIAICTLDFIAFLISLMNIAVLFCLAIDITYCEKFNDCCKNCCIFFFFLCCLWKILDCWKQNRNYIALKSKTEREIDDIASKTIISETTAWLLMISFVAPLVCLGTHSGFVLIAWASDPSAAGSMTIFFVLSFLYYYFGFRQLYIVIASRCQDVEGCKSKTKRKCFACNRNESNSDGFQDKTCTCCCITCRCYTIREASEELDQHHENLKLFNFKVLCCAIPLAFVLIGAHGLSIAAYVLLPSSLIGVPSSLLNLLHWALIIGSGLIAYKLLTLHTPYEEIIAENLLKAYDSTITSKDYPKQLGEIFGKVLKKYHPPTVPSSSQTGS